MEVFEDEYFIPDSAYRDKNEKDANPDDPLFYRDDYGVVFWTYKGVSHRSEGPAIEYLGGSAMYYRMGKVHRDDGPAIIDIEDNTQEWWQDGKRHRDGGPAVLTPFRKEYRCHGELHRDDGPAIEKINPKYNEWWFHGVQLDAKLEREFNDEWIRENPSV